MCSRSIAPAPFQCCVHSTTPCGCVHRLFRTALEWCPGSKSRYPNLYASQPVSILRYTSQSLIRNSNNYIANRINIPTALLRGGNNYTTDGINTVLYRTLPFTVTTAAASQIASTSCCVDCSRSQQQQQSHRKLHNMIHWEYSRIQ